MWVGRAAVAGLATTVRVRVRDAAGAVVGSGFLVGTISWPPVRTSS
jgi:hypothetical protein